MADLSIPAEPVGDLGTVQGRAVAVFAGLAPMEQLPATIEDYRYIRAATATITDQVVLKSGAAETPFVLGRVWLLRLADGFKAWEGWSDANGYYTATGLEVGVDYVAVAIDPLRNHKTTGAGPVTAA